MTVGWQAAGDGDGDPPPSNTGGGCGGVLQPASAMRGDGGPGSGDDVLVSAADSPVGTHVDINKRQTSSRLRAVEKEHRGLLEATNRN